MKVVKCAELSSFSRHHSKTNPHVYPFGAPPLVLLLRSFLAPNLQTLSSLQHWGLQLACENVLSLSLSLACFFLQLLLSSEVSGSGQVLVANMLSSGSHPSLQTCELWRNGSSASQVRCTWISGAEGAKAEIIWNFSRFLNVSHLVRLEATHPARKSGIKGSRKKTKKTYFRIIEQLQWTRLYCKLQFWYWSLEGYKLNQSCMAASSPPLQCWRPSHSAGQQHPLWNCSSNCTHHVSSNSAPSWNTHLHDLVGIPPRRVRDNHRNRHRNQGPSIHPPAPRSPCRLQGAAGLLVLHWRIAPGPFAQGSNGQRGLGIWRHPERAACWDLQLQFFHRPQSGPQCNSAWFQGCKVWSEPLHILRSGNTQWTKSKERQSSSWNTDCLDLN